MSSSREIDLAARPGNALVWFARVVARLCQIGFWCALAAAAFPSFLVLRRSFKGAAGAAITFLFQRLGATFIKIGQILSTRPDLLSAEFIAPLTTLQDRVPPFRFGDVRRTIEDDFGRKLEEIFAEFAPEPVASASIAQVHRAVLQHAELPPSIPSRVVAVKVRRPGIVRRAYLDESILRFFARIVSRLPWFSLLSPLEGVSQFCEAVNKQLDLRIEAENNRRFRKNFEDDSHVIFPALVDQLCSDRVLTMEFIDGVGLDKIRAVGSDPWFLAKKGLEVVCRMVFHHGFVHADVHPGNLLYLAGNRMAVLDVGLVGVLDPENRRRFALFSYYGMTGKGVETARWLYEESAWKQVPDYAAYEREVVDVVKDVYDRPIEETQLSGQLIKIYSLMRRHRLRFEATFTIANLALMIAEGLARRIGPKLNLNRDARPYLEAALAMGAANRLPAESRPGASMPTAIASGRYRIRRLLGEGVRKRVYLARDTRLERDVAVALFRTEDLDEAGLARIGLEARAVARLADHPRIVPVYDSGEEGGVPFVVSQYMGGGTLSSRLLRATEHRLPIEETLRFADQILQALEHAHALGVVHRDVKPENVWLTADGFAKLGDFGLARTLGRVESALEGLTVGTALYMPPEQALGRGVDHRSDLYSLGATLYELLTGHPPFAGENVAEVIARHVNAIPEPPSRHNPKVPPTLDAILLKLLAKLPENRFESAAGVREVLRDLPADGETAVPPEKESGVPSPAPSIFIGREQEIARLRTGLEDALAGHGRLSVLGGEPGIGKTRVGELLAGYAERRGCLVLIGRSYEGAGAPVFWPWVQVVRGYIAARDAARLETELGGGAAHVAQIVPELREIIPGLPEITLAEGEEGRFRLFDAVSSFLKRAASGQPLFILLDDLHWADKASLLLLHFLTRELSGSRVFIVATYRDVDIQHGHPLADVLPALRRERGFERVLLRGLPEDEVRALVNALAGAEAPDTFVRAIYRETEGNPFFVEETLRHLSEEGVVVREGGRWTSRVGLDEMGLPEGIREVIGRRLTRLSEDCRKVLTAASVLGRNFDAHVLGQLASVEPERLTELLEEATRALIIEADDRGLRHRFSHALIRETLYAELGAGDRVRLHRKIAGALERLHAGTLDEHLSELAYHYFEAAPGGDVERAIDFSIRAGERADKQHAYEEAMGFYDRALRALQESGRRDESRECELLISLGTAQWRSSEGERSKQSLRRAADLAGRTGKSEALARAAITYRGEEMQPMFSALEQDTVPLLEAALAALPAEDGALRATVMGRLAGSLFFSGQEERRRRLFDDAAEMATRLGDSRALASVLLNRLIARWGAEPLSRSREDGATLARLAEKLRDDRLMLFSAGFRGILAAETGDFEAAIPWFTEGERIAERLPHLRWFIAYVATGWALTAAKPAEADQMIQRTFDSASAGAGTELAMPLVSTQKAISEWQQGKSRDSGVALLKHVSTTFARTHEHPMAAQWAIFAEGDSARREAVNRVKDLAAIPRDTFWMFRVALAAGPVEALGEVEIAHALYEALLPHSDRCVNPGMIYCFGSVARYLGLLAKTLSRYGDSVGHFDRALEIERHMPICQARTRYEYARLLALRAAPGDRERAIGLCGRAIEGARDYGLQKVAADAVALKLELEGVASASVRSSIEAVTASLEAKGIEVGHATAPNGTVTLLFTEMEGFTELTDELGDTEAHRLMQIQRALLRGELRQHGGSEIEEQGDGFLFAFPKATEALRYATAVQGTLAAHRAEHPDERLHVRMGIHTGEPIKEGERFHGRTVILAARIAAHAQGDEILVSSLVHELIGAAGEFRFDEGESVSFAGLSGTFRIHGVVWDESAPARRVRAPASSATGPLPKDLTPAENVFKREGDFWTVTYERRSIRMKDAKGMQYIAALLRRQGEEIHVTELVNGASAGAERAALESLPAELNVSADLGDAGEVLDAKARDDYRARLEGLRFELEEAQGMNDTGRAERLGQEIEFLTQELASAYGLGGRSRRSSSPTDRARKALSSRVLDTISRIRKENPALGAHFGLSIRLGLFCRYQPERHVPWSL